MDKPTRGQWRGYAILFALLLLTFLLMLFLPLHVNTPQPDDNSQLAEAVALYGDEMFWNDNADELFRNNSADSSFHRRLYVRNSDSRRYLADSTCKPRYYPSYSNRYSRRLHYDTLQVDINTADTARLQLLRGIGPVLASRIVKYRHLLGGFVSCNQLIEVYGIDIDLLESIRPHIIASDDHVKRLSINSATFDQLRHHPYLDYYQARAIVDYRNTVGPIKSHSDLYKINLLDEKTIIKISPYIQYNP